jgi:hypothetical protein
VTGDALDMRGFGIDSTVSGDMDLVEIDSRSPSGSWSAAPPGATGAEGGRAYCARLEMTTFSLEWEDLAEKVESAVEEGLEARE